MAIELRDCDFFGPALPEPFVKFELERHLNRLGLLPRAAGADGQTLQREWEPLYRKLRELAFRGGEVRVRNNVLEPLAERLGYVHMVKAEAVRTREGDEDAGWLMESADGKQRLRVWAVGLGTDLDAPNRRGRQYRFSPSRIAQRVMLAQSERIGLLTDGEELRILLCDPARPDSQIVIRLDKSSGWRGSRSVPDSYRLLKALASPAGVAALPELTEEARLNQTTVTKKLRQQARAAVEGFIQELIDHSANREKRESWTDLTTTSRELWREGLILVYRLLFIFKLESSADPARAFSFAATSLWRNSYSPNIALAPFVRKVLDDGVDSGSFLEESLRTVFRIFAEGLSSSELRVFPLGGALFGPETTPLVNALTWGEQAVAKLLDRLLWTPGDGRTERERVHYGTLDVEDLGRVYEALLELEPGITTEPMCRLRRAKLEVVVALAQGAPYCADVAMEETDDEGGGDNSDEDSSRPGKTKVQWVEEIPTSRFYLRVGLGRKASGSYYTPHPFVRFLVQEALTPQVQERSPADNPSPGEILKLKVLDPAMGSGHFLVEACRYLGDALYEACRLCDEHALELEEKAETAEDEERKALLAQAAELRQRVEVLPDPNDELVAYLPSRVPEGLESGHSQRKAEAICRRLVAVHCLYGVDRNELAVELAKLSLWLESYAEGLPLTFLDHRMVCGDSLTGPFFEHLLRYPRSGELLQGLFADGLVGRLQGKLARALTYVRELEASVGKDIADLESKRLAKANLDEELAPFKLLAAAWSGGVVLEERCNDDDYRALAEAVVSGVNLVDVVTSRPRLQEMVETGAQGALFDLTFPEVFHPDGVVERGGFHAVLGNPPWEGIDTSNKEFFAPFEFGILDAKTKDEEDAIILRLLKVAEINHERVRYERFINGYKRMFSRFFKHVNVGAQAASGATPDLYQGFTERGYQLGRNGGYFGMVLPSALHANEGATGLRRLLLDDMALKACFSFENRKKLFEIDTRYKYAVVISVKNGSGTDSFQSAFYLKSPDWLFALSERPELLTYSKQFIDRTTGALANFLELRSADSVPVVENMYHARDCLFGELRSREKVRPTEELHKSKNKGRLVLSKSISSIQGSDLRLPEQMSRLRQEGLLPLVEGKTFHQYNDIWDDPPEFCVPIANMAGKESRLAAARFFRLAFRTVASSTNERTAIFTILTPGVICAHNALPEASPAERPTSAALMVTALANSFSFDWLLRQSVSANVTFNFLDAVPVPHLQCIRLFLAHAALRLTCNHVGYEPLWTEQVGTNWRETASRDTWPVLKGDAERGLVRARIDAVVAQSYGLDRERYSYILSSFSHSSYSEAPSLCLAAFDELMALGQDAFCKKYDPYWDIPLNENLPRPVIALSPEGELQPLRRQGRSSKKSVQYSLFEESPGPLFDFANNSERQ